VQRLGQVAEGALAVEAFRLEGLEAAEIPSWFRVEEAGNLVG